MIHIYNICVYNTHTHTHIVVHEALTVSVALWRITRNKRHASTIRMHVYRLYGISAALPKQARKTTQLSFSFSWYF